MNSSDLADGTSQTLYKPVPLSYKGPAPSYVDKVVITSNESDHFLVKVSLPLFSLLLRAHHRSYCVKLDDLKLGISSVVDMDKKVSVASSSIRRTCPLVRLGSVQISS